MVDKVLGAKVRIEVKEEGSYEGYVHNIDQETNKLTLVKGLCSPLLLIYLNAQAWFDSSLTFNILRPIQ